MKINPATREEFHKLIDTIDHGPRLEAYLFLIKEINTCENSELWNNLTEGDRQQIIEAYEESFDPNNLVDHEVVMEGIEKWLNRKSNGIKKQRTSLTR